MEVGESGGAEEMGGSTVSLLVALAGATLELSWGTCWGWRLGQTNAWEGRVEDLWDLQEMALKGQEKFLEVFCCRAADDNFLLHTMYCDDFYLTSQRIGNLLFSPQYH